MPGRKTEAKDGAWLAELVEVGLRRASFIPPQPSREWRALTRYRTTLGPEHPRDVNRIHQLVESANRQLGVVAPDIMGASGRAILRALRAGDRDGVVLAEWAKGGVRQKRAQLTEALTGRFTAHPAGLLGERLAHIE